jgi:hypothetical protein
VRQLVFIPNALVLRKDEDEASPERPIVEWLFQPLPLRATLRLVTTAEGQLRSLAWLRVGGDGSVYWGPTRAPTRRGFVEKDRKAYLSGAGAEEQMVEDAEEQRRFHFSFHPSGAVNAGKARSYRRPWNAIIGAEQLCAVYWEHPRGLPTVAPRRRDLLVRYPLVESKPLFGSLNVVPSGQLALLGNAELQQVLEFGIVGKQPIANMTVQLAIGHGPVGPWIGGTHVAWNTLGPPSVRG